MNLNVNHLVAFLTIILAIALYSVLVKYGVPLKIAMGITMLAILLSGVFWTGVYLGAHDDEDD